MSEVGLTDLSKLLHTKRGQNNAIVTSRKRKLRELFAVATHADDQSHDAIANTDAPATTQAEGNFLQANEIFQGKKLSIKTIPTRSQLPFESLHRSLAILSQGTPAAPLPPPSDKQKGTVSPPNAQNGQPPKLSQAARSNPSTPAASTGSPAGSQIDATSTTTSKASPAPSSRPSSTKPIASALAPPANKAQSAATGSVSPAAQSPRLAPAPAITDGTDQAKDDANATQRRPAQVSFPPGTKGSPAPGAANATEAAGKTEDADAVTSISKPDASVSAPKLSTDLSRAAEAPSSPESTVRSATTPAVHDASTDTSPENAGPTYTESTEEKTGQPDTDAQSESTDAKAQQPEEPIVESAEDQLLQESNAASDQAEKIADVKATSAQDDSVVVATQPEEGLPEGKHAQSSDIRVHQDADKSEIPDSREESPEQMDVDQVDVKTSTETATQADTQKEPSTPTAPKDTPKDTSQPAQRAVTRVSSGAMRPKSVNEIVGNRPGFDRPFAAKDLEDQLTPLTGASQSPGSRSRPMSSGRKQKGQVSSVVFGKQPKRLDEKTVTGTSKEPLHPSDDYFTPLFIQGFARGSQWMQPLEKILFHANKTVGTADANLAIQDHQACKVLHRVYHLQNHDKWTLRQPKRCPEPTRPPSHWDMMLKEAKWMRTDFREERKWKTAVARNLAEACAVWCESSPEERKAMQVPAVIPPKPTMDDVTMGDDEGTDNADNAPTPDLISGDVDSPQHPEELMEVFSETISPSAIFSLQEDDVVFGLRQTAASDKLLEELPMYGSPLKVWRTDPLAPDFDPDAKWRRPAVPLSKYVEGQMRIVEEGPPRKKSRFDFDEDNEDEENDVVFVNDMAVHHATMPPSTDEVALFRPEMKHIRDRLHAGHQFRPPTEHPMPSQSFYECRNASMWTQAEDDELRSLVREYSYNWPLISSMLTSKSLYSSGAERRTPWECFERWINLEGLPSDMQKTQYFRAYNSRIEAAQRVVMQNQQVAAQQANPAGGPPQPIRRRPTTPMRVERRRNQKHLALLDAMRKLAKKRETTIQKQQHTAAQNAANAANKKPNDAAAAQRPNKTPAEYSILRWERDQALAEKMAAFAQRQEATKRAAMMQARAQGQGGQGQANQGMQAGQQANAANGAARPNQAAGANAARQQQQQRMPMQAPNGMAAAGQAQMAGQQNANGQMNNGAVQQGQMQGMANQQRMAVPGHQQQPDASMMMRAQRISEQQRQAVQAQQHQQVQQQMQHPQQMQQQQQQQQGGSGTPRPSSQHNSPPNMANGVNGAGMTMNGMNGMNGTSGTAHQNFIHNQQAMMQSFNNANANGQASPPAMYMGSASPGSRPNLNVPPAFHNHIQQLEQQIRAKNPNMKPEQARQMAVDHMARAMLAQRQNAMTAAAGGAGAGQQHGVANNIGATTSPHQYAALLRQQQQQQAAQQQQQQQAAAQAASSPGQSSSHNRQSSEGATPGTAQ